jgi:hypothetical protein
VRRRHAGLLHGRDQSNGNLAAHPCRHGDLLRLIRARVDPPCRRWR